MTEERLARRYWHVLDAYPRAYREERGEELVGTLVECARPGQAWPRWREVRALTLEGLRMRAGTGGRRSARSVLLDGLQFTVLLLLAAWALGFATEALRYGFPHANGRVIATGLLAFGAVPFVLVALGRFRWALPFLAVGAVAWVPWYEFDGAADHVLHRVLTVAVATLVAAVVLWWKQPMGWRAHPAVVAFAVVVPVLHDLPTWLMEFGFDNWPDVLWAPQALLFVLLYLGVLAWAAVDPRPAMAFGAYIFVDFAGAATFAAMMPHPFGSELAIMVAVLLMATPGVALAAAWAGVRRQAAAEPLKIGR